MYKIDKTGYSDEYQAKIEFSAEEIAQIYNQVKELPQEFYDNYKSV